MMKKILIGTLLVIAGVSIYLAVVFVVYNRKEEITAAQAQALSQEHLQLAADNFDVFSGKLKFPQFEPEQLRNELKTGEFARPQQVRVTSVENRILIGGLDTDSVSDVAGTFLCGESKETKDFRIRFIHDKSDKQWRVMDFVVESCL